MALSASSVFEVRTVGNDTNGGGFVTGASGTDYSQQDAKNTVGDNISTTDAASAGSNTITSATAAFLPSIIGNIIYFQGGTGALAAGRYQVTSRPNATTITVDRNIVSGTGMTMNIGGAVASLGILGSTTATILVGGNKIFIKAGTYTITSSTINVSDGCFSKAINVYIEGYQTTRGDLGTPPLITADGVITTFTLINLSGTVTVVKNINLDGNSRTSSRAFNIGNNAFIYKCKVSNCTNGGFLATGGQPCAFLCSATGCTTTTAFSGFNCFGCVAFSNTITGFTSGNTINVYIRCLSYNNSGATSDGFINASVVTQYVNCVAYNNGRHGFSSDGNNSSWLNCISEDNVNTGFINPAGTAVGQSHINCGAFSNATNFSIGTSTYNINQGPIIGTGSFFTNAAAGDFSLNNTAGAGADLRAAALLGIFPEGLTTGYLDIGAAQHQDAGGGGSVEHSAVF